MLRAARAPAVPGPMAATETPPSARASRSSSRKRVAPFTEVRTTQS